MLNGESGGQMFAQRLHTVALRGVVTGGEIVNRVFARDVHRGLGDFTADEGIQPAPRRFLQVGLRGSGAPADAANGLRSAGNALRLTAQRIPDAGSEVRDR